VSAESFAARFQRLADARSPLCVGVDPSAATLARLGLPDTPEGLRRFALTMAEAAGPVAAVIKPQAAHFERHGAEGMAILAETLRAARAAGALTIADVKRGDIGETMESYAAAWLGPGAPFPADAMTALPGMGFATLEPLLRAAEAAGGAVFAVVLSSNPEGAALQHARLPDGRSVAQSLAASIAARNAAAPAPAAGAVIGATLGEAARPVIAALDGALVLAPGIGAQGAGFADAARLFAPHGRSVVPNVSRAAVPDRLDPSAIAERARRLADEAWLLRR
jgi:orotidine-5'-phosphate decarboxylase